MKSSNACRPLGVIASWNVSHGPAMSMTLAPSVTTIATLSGLSVGGVRRGSARDVVTDSTVAISQTAERSISAFSTFRKVAFFGVPTMALEASVRYDIDPTYSDIRL